MRHTLKFLHTMGTIGITGGLAAYMLVLVMLPQGAALETQLVMRDGLAFLSKWLIMPSMLVVLISGLLAIAANTAFLEAPWVWTKGLAGILVFETTLLTIDGPAQRNAKFVSEAVAGNIEKQALSGMIIDEWGALWILLGLFIANVVLAIWRPRFGHKR